MIRGLYTSASGMAAQMKAHDINANNLANTNTSGFKKDIPVFSPGREMNLSRLGGRMPTSNLNKPIPIGAMGSGVRTEEIITSHRQGQLRKTDRELDFAVEGKGFFVVETPEERMYTRKGEFTAGIDGYLQTKDGHRVLGENNLPLAAEDVEPEAFLLVNFPDAEIPEKIGDSLYFTEADEQIAGNEAEVRQGMLEEANIVPVSAMVDMIAGMRAYEANQKALQAQDQNLDKTVNEIGRVR